MKNAKNEVTLATDLFISVPGILIIPNIESTNAAADAADAGGHLGRLR